MKDICHIVIMGLINNYKEFGGETGIRTPEPVTQLLPFQGSAIDHSAISPDYCCSILPELNLRISQSDHR